MVKGHHFQLRCCPPLCYYFKYFNIEVATVYHPVIQKERDEPLAKGTLNYVLVVPAFTLISLWYLNTYSILSN